MAARNQTPVDVAHRVGAKPGHGYVSRWLYGDLLPTRHYADRLRSAYGIKIALWEAAPTEAFQLPAVAATIQPVAAE